MIATEFKDSNLIIIINKVGDLRMIGELPWWNNWEGSWTIEGGKFWSVYDRYQKCVPTVKWYLVLVHPFGDYLIGIQKSLSLIKAPCMPSLSHLYASWVVPFSFSGPPAFYQLQCTASPPSKIFCLSRRKRWPKSWNFFSCVIVEKISWRSDEMMNMNSAI